VQAKQVIREAGDIVKTVYFPNGGVSSNIATLQEGWRVETATVGGEGMLGVEAFLSPEAIAVSKVGLQVGGFRLSFRRLPVRHTAADDSPITYSKKPCVSAGFFAI
jgi:hypothetical protein